MFHDQKDLLVPIDAGRGTRPIAEYYVNEAKSPLPRPTSSICGIIVMLKAVMPDA